MDFEPGKTLKSSTQLLILTLLCITVSTVFEAPSDFSAVPLGGGVVEFSWTSSEIDFLIEFTDHGSQTTRTERVTGRNLSPITFRFDPGNYSATIRCFECAATAAGAPVNFVVAEQVSNDGAPPLGVVIGVPIAGAVLIGGLLVTLVIFTIRWWYKSHFKLKKIKLKMLGPEHDTRPKWRELQLIKYSHNSKNHKLDLMTEISTSWRRLGGQMGVSPGNLDRIGAEHMHNLRERCEEVLKIWFENESEDYPMTWAGLICALVDIQEVDIAEKLTKIIRERSEETQSQDMDSQA